MDEDVRNLIVAFSAVLVVIVGYWLFLEWDNIKTSIDGERVREILNIRVYD